MMKILDEAAVTYQLVLTKADAAPTPPDLSTVIAAHVAAYPEALLTSSETGQGLEELREMLAGFAVE